MGKEFVLIGAGSYVFTRNLVRDILTYPAFQDAELHLVDINPVNLENARKAVMHIVEAGQYPREGFLHHGPPRGPEGRGRRAEHADGPAAGGIPKRSVHLRKSTA